jgi:hypothetical protein
MPEKIDSVRFGIAGGLATSLFVALFEIFLWLKVAPIYNYIMAGVYGAGGITGLVAVKIMILSVILSFIIGGIFAWIFAWLYNRIPYFRVK